MLEQERLEWCCTDCDKTFVKPLRFFLRERCTCPECGAPLNMGRLREVLSARTGSLNPPAPR